MTAVPPDNLDRLEAWLAAREAAAERAAGQPLVPGTEKSIAWAGGAPRRTPLSIVYLHGFAASRQEIAPVLDHVAGRLQANLFATRLTGSGLGADGMAAASIEAWTADVEEAWAVGNAVGERVALVGMSTGAPLAAWLAHRRRDCAALVLLSPNFWPLARGARLLLAPAGRLLARLIVGRYRDVSGDNELESRYWTMRQHSSSLVPMMQAVQLGRRTPLQQLRCPCLVVYAEQDQVVSVRAIKRAYGRIGSANKRLYDLPGAEGHALAGDILAPATVPSLVRAIVALLADAGFSRPAAAGARPLSPRR